MKKFLKYVLPAVVVGLLVAGTVSAQVAPANLWKLVGGVLQPINSAWTVAVKFFDNGGLVYNVKAFGAKCDGVTNDTTAFQNAITAAASATVQIPSGVCVITPNVLDLPSNISIRGVSKNTAEILSNNTSTLTETWIFRINGKSNVTISDLYFSNKTLSPIGTVATGGEAIRMANGASNVTISDDIFEQWYNDVFGGTVGNSLFTRLTDLSGASSFGGNKGSRDLINIDELSDSIISNNNGYLNDTCIRISGAQRVNVTANQCHWVGIELGNEGGYADSINITSNHFFWGAGIGLFSFQNTTATTQLINSYRSAVNNVNIAGNSFTPLLGATTTLQAVLTQNANSSSSITNINFVANTVNGSPSSTNAANMIEGLNNNAGGFLYNWNISSNQFANVPGVPVKLISCVGCTIQNNSFTNFNMLGVTSSSAVSILASTTATSSNVQISWNSFNGNNNAGSVGIFFASSSLLNSINVFGDQFVGVPNGAIAYTDTAPASSTIFYSSTGSSTFNTVLNVSVPSSGSSNTVASFISNGIGGGNGGIINFGTYTNWTNAAPAVMKFLDDNFSNDIAWFTKATGGTSGGLNIRLWLGVNGNNGVNTLNPSSSFQVIDSTNNSSTLLIGASSTKTGCLEMVAASGTAKVVYVWYDSNAVRYESTTKQQFCQ